MSKLPRTEKTGLRGKIAPLLQGPQLPVRFQSTEISTASGRLEEGCRLEEAAIHATDCSGDCARNAVFERSQFSGVVFKATELPQIDLVDVLFESCDLSNASWFRGRSIRTEFVECRALGLKMIEFDFRDTQFTNCNCVHAQFRVAKFVHVAFTNCNLRGADFSEADLRGVAFTDCDLREANMSFAKLARTDLRRSQIDGLQVGPESLKGAIVLPLQAAQLASVLGLDVRWTDDTTTG